MEKIPNTEKIDYEKALNVEFVEVSSSESRGDKTLTFSITPEFNILLSYGYHVHMTSSRGVSPELTLAEGYVKINKVGQPEIFFKPRYQPVPGFKGSEEELALLQRAAKNEILEFIKNNPTKYEN